MPYQPHRPGVKAHLSDSEVMTLELLMDYLPFPGETQFLGFIRANYLEWFPHLFDQSQFNRRLRQLAKRLKALRRHWFHRLVTASESYFIVDTKPIPVLGLKRDKRFSDFAGNSTTGYCAARKMYYFYMVPANTDERLAVETILQTVRHSDVYRDKGFLSDESQCQLYRQTGNRM